MTEFYYPIEDELEVGVEMGIFSSKEKKRILNALKFSDFFRLEESDWELLGGYFEHFLSLGGWSERQEIALITYANFAYLKANNYKLLKGA
jgi:hypothetical protein